jgi:hypothetical protein
MVIEQTTESVASAASVTVTVNVQVLGKNGTPVTSPAALIDRPLGREPAVMAKV